MVKKKAIQGHYHNDVRELLTGTLKSSTYVKYLSAFLKEVAKAATCRALQEQNLVGGKEDWKVLYYGLKIVYPEETFGGSES